MVDINNVQGPEDLTTSVVDIDFWKTRGQPNNPIHKHLSDTVIAYFNKMAIGLGELPGNNTRQLLDIKILNRHSDPSVRITLPFLLPKYPVFGQAAINGEKSSALHLDIRRSEWSGRFALAFKISRNDRPAPRRYSVLIAGSKVGRNSYHQLRWRGPGLQPLSVIVNEVAQFIDSETLRARNNLAYLASTFPQSSTPAAPAP